MTAEEIREWHKAFENANVTAEVARARARIEIAAQLAELNESLRGFANGYLPVGLCATNDVIPVMVKEL